MKTIEGHDVKIFTDNIEGKAREEYLHDMRLCQRWAVLNRKLGELPAADVVVQTDIFFAVVMPLRPTEYGQSKVQKVDADGTQDMMSKPMIM